MEFWSPAIAPMTVGTLVSVSEIGRVLPDFTVQVGNH